MFCDLSWLGWTDYFRALKKKWFREFHSHFLKLTRAPLRGFVVRPDPHYLNFSHTKRAFDILCSMTKRQFYDWQTAGGADDVMRMVDALERAEVSWCAIGGVAVNHWAAEPMVTRDVDFVVAAENLVRAEQVLCEAGFTAERHEWSINFVGKSSVSLQLTTEPAYRDFPAHAVAADVHGILLRVASLQDTMAGKVMAYSDSARRQSKRIKDLADIVRLVESHPELRASLPLDLQRQIEP